MHIAVRYRVLVAALVSLVVVAGLVSAQRGSTSTSTSPGSAPAGATAYLMRAISHGLLKPNRAVSHKRVGKVTSYTSNNWSGYADDNSTGTSYTKISAGWVEPAVTCPSDENRLAAYWVGIDGFNNGSVEQDGSLVECYQGNDYHYTWWEMYPTNAVQVVGNSVAPGDKISSSVVFSASTSKYTLKVTDSTHTANSFTKVEACGSGVTCSNASAEWIAESPGTARGQAPIPDFKVWKVTAAKVTGKGTAGTISSFPDDKLTMVDNNSDPLATPGALAAGGAQFSDTWNYAW